MLVLTRKSGESIQIGDDIVVTWKWHNRQSIRVIIDAPRHVSVVRSELLERDQLVRSEE